MGEELKEKLNKQVEKQIEEILEEGVHSENVEMLGELVDIHKDLKNEEYWKNKEEVYKMRYSEGNYNDGYGRRGNYRARGGYGARGRYRGGMEMPEDKMEEMMEHYNNYNEARSEYNRGNYGAGSEKMRSLESMLECGTEFFEAIQEQAESPEEMEMVKKYLRKMGNM